MRVFKNAISLVLITVLACIILTGCTIEIANKVDDIDEYKDNLIIHFLDVGQGDSTLIQFPNGETSLIDGGSRRYGEKITNYIKNLGIEKIDYLIATHPHEDHIGGLPEVIRNLEIGKVYMPNRTANTLIFEELLLEIKNKNLTINIAKANDYIIYGEKLNYYVIAPIRDDYAKTNDFSIVTRIEYRGNSIIIAGDAEEASEMDMLQNKARLESDVFRVGHHGGRTSSNESFLMGIKPKYSIISVGDDNSYGHPHKETIDRLNKMGSHIMQTDILGDIVLMLDGDNITIVKENFKETRTNKEYIGNKNTKIYHSKGCNSLPKEENQIFFDSKMEAEQNGYKPHDKCIKQEASE